MRPSLTTRMRGLAAAVIALSAAAFMTTPASATPASVVDGTQRGSITVNKFETPAGGANDTDNNGSKLDPAQMTGWVALKGVGFTLSRVTSADPKEPIDLTTNLGWQRVEAADASFDGTIGSLESHGFAVATHGAETFTDTTGIAAFTDLPLGLYLLQETAPAANAVPLAPFLVSVPMTSPAGDDWMYDINVYPKNSITTASKTVDDAAAVKVGDAVTYTITGDIPNDKIIDVYRVVDQLSQDLNHVSTAVRLTNDAELVAGTDYVLTAVDNKIVVDFTEAGRVKLVANNQEQVVVTINTTVRVAGEILNSATIFPSSTSLTTLPGKPGGPIVTPPVETKWGGFTLQKQDAKGASLTGAGFAIYASLADVASDTRIKINGDEDGVYEVDAQGILTIDGLRYSAYADGADVAEDHVDHRTYYVVEVQAPDGYELLAAPMPVIVDSAPGAHVVPVTNVPSNGGAELPLTGGTGTYAFLAGGALLIAGAVGIILYVRRRDDASV